jgi:alkylated DNA nucleotide flippase Atl1
MPALREFSFDQVVDVYAGKQDKIDLRIAHNIYTGTVEDIDAFRNHLGGPPAAVNQEDFGSAYSRIFNRPEIATGLRKPLEIRKGRNPSLPNPLFTGNYRFTSYGHLSEEGQTATTLQLFLNPTRFLRYQNSSNYVPPRQMFDSRDETLFYPANRRIGGETALDDSDNWIPDTPQFERLHHPAFWNRVLRSYVEGTLRIINADIERARTNEHVQLHARASGKLKPLSLRSVETYFEFRSSNPLRTVLDLESLLLSYNELGLTTADYPVSGQWESNSRALRLKIRTGVTLSVYAKTNRRVRFEVTHDLAKARYRLPDLKPLQRLPQTFSNTNALYDMLEILREDSARVVNDVLAHCRDRKSIPATNKTSIDLLFDIASTVGSRDNARQITDILCLKGSVSSLPDYRVALAKLKRAGILKTQDRNARQEYVVTDAYKFPLQMLQEHASFPHLTIRKRTRGGARPVGS